MSPSICLLAISLATAQFPETQVPPRPVQPGNFPAYTATAPAPAQPAPQFPLIHRVRQRITNIFNPQPAPLYPASSAPIYPQYQIPQTSTKTPSSPVRISQPVPVQKTGSGQTSPEVTQTTFTPARISQFNMPLHPQLEEKVGHDPEYRWITGQLYYTNNMWVVRYTVDHQVERYGGYVILSTTAEMGQFRPGDLICVNGSITNQNSANQLGAPVFHATHVHLIERPE